MKTRLWLSKLRKIAYDISKQSAEKFSLETLQLNNDLITLSLDPTVDPQTQSFLLLVDVDAYLTRLEQASEPLDLYDKAQMKPVATKGKRFLPEINKTFEEHQENQEIRKKLKIQVMELMNEYIRENILEEIDQAKYEDTHEFMQKLLSIFLAKFTITQDKNKNLNDFDLMRALQNKESTGAYSHPTLIMRKKHDPLSPPTAKHLADWFAKYYQNRTTAAREVVGQEFCRLVDPDQQKSRTASNSHFESYSLSRSIEDTKSLAKIPKAVLRERIKSGAYTGFGRIMVLNLFLNETDAKLGNLIVKERVDANGVVTGEVKKIDGDWFFSRLRDKRYANTSAITAEDIELLPRIKTYEAYHWFDVSQNRTLNTKYDTNPAETMLGGLIGNPDFRREVNETLLNLLIMPPPLLMDFLKGYLKDPVEISILSDELADRQAQMRAAALKSPSFREYLQTAEAAAHFDVCVNNMQDFQFFTNDTENKLIHEIPENTRKIFLRELNNLKKEALDLTPAETVSHTNAETPRQSLSAFLDADTKKADIDLAPSPVKASQKLFQQQSKIPSQVENVAGPASHVSNKQNKP